MPATVERETISPQLERVVQTGAENQSPISPTVAGSIRQGWQRVIADILENWLKNPRQLEDDGIEPPTGRTIRIALDVAEGYRDSWQQAIPPPNRVIVDPNGGIVFESQDGQIVEEVHIWDDGTVEYMKFDGARLIRRTPLFGGN